MPFDEGPLRDILLDPDGVSFPLNGEPPVLSLCPPCHSSLKTKKLPPLSLANKTFLGTVPEELKNLTVIDKAMIARCRSKCWIIQLKEENQDLSVKSGISNPDCLPDHRGPYFAHQVSKLIQRNYKDVDGDLITPQELYGKLTEGTLFSAQISLHTYIWGGNPGFLRNKVYHIYVERLKILDKGYGQVWNPSFPVLPSPLAPSNPQKRGRAERDDNADSAFDAFNSISPTKRSRK
ncbi:hypothetical protein B0H13DRAFT_2326569 [Mycena leptocephala]|nr:hypothetical protein B0H13DRAFT_2326569 [Mycena leptocephala]